MNRRWVVIGVVTLGLFVATPGGGAVASATVRLVISHVAVNCHVWKKARPLGAVKTLGPSTRIVVRPGTRVVIRADCPMDFDFTQTKGPRLALGDPRTYAGSTRVIVFTRPGVYRLTAKNVQTPEERGLVTLGEPNTLTLTVAVTT
jgi:hypothetical protein